MDIVFSLRCKYTPILNRATVPAVIISADSKNILRYLQRSNPKSSTNKKAFVLLIRETKCVGVGKGYKNAQIPYIRHHCGSLCRGSFCKTSGIF